MNPAEAAYTSYQIGEQVLWRNQIKWFWQLNFSPVINIVRMYGGEKSLRISS